MKRVADGRLLAVLLCLLVAAGCGALTEVMNLSNRVKDAGYTNVQANHSTNNGFDTVTITASGGPEGSDGEDIARLVWDTYPAEVDRLVLRLNGKDYSATNAELEKAFGPRKIQPDPDNAISGESILWWVIGIGLFFLLLVGALITVLVVVMRKRRRRMQMQMPPPPPPYPYYKP
ncbi:hypothetical protein [Saccharothrix deserti]|uniref:hypothetical protein n=1 Tax=Saccharothrix deserti TaxID=2593674 RepID=UPI00131E16BE|nr:hypothetical protein [Saccharothrix deserti]